jgi:AraC-like DNA-binding protein
VVAVEVPRPRTGRRGSRPGPGNGSWPRDQDVRRPALHDPDLGPAVLAAAHHISTSYLHRLFRADGDLTVAAWIRGRRLERARHGLADPALRALPISRIAARCGFADHVAFTRAFGAC